MLPSNLLESLTSLPILIVICRYLSAYQGWCILCLAVGAYILEYLDLRSEAFEFLLVLAFQIFCSAIARIL